MGSQSHCQEQTLFYDGIGKSYCLIQMVNLFIMFLPLNCHRILSQFICLLHFVPTCILSSVTSTFNEEADTRKTFKLPHPPQWKNVFVTWECKFTFSNYCKTAQACHNLVRDLTMVDASNSGAGMDMDTSFNLNHAVIPNFPVCS